MFTHKHRNDICISALLADGVVVKFTSFKDVSKPKQAVEINITPSEDIPAPAWSKHASSHNMWDNNITADYVSPQ